jgi:hypothetical protein
MPESVLSAGGAHLWAARFSFSEPEACFGADMRFHSTVVSLLNLALGAASSTPLAAQVMQTGDAAKRGLKPSDFPRARQLAAGVFSYEALRAGDPGVQMTTVSLIVIGNEKVLDGAGPKAKVLFMSESYLHSIFPAMRSAYPTEWIQTLKNDESIDAVWFVPGHGFVDDAKTVKADLPAYRHAVEQVVAEATRLHGEDSLPRAGPRCVGRSAARAL